MEVGSVLINLPTSEVGRILVGKLCLMRFMFEIEVSCLNYFILKLADAQILIICYVQCTKYLSSSLYWVCLSSDNTVIFVREVPSLNHSWVPSALLESFCGFPQSPSRWWDNIFKQDKTASFKILFHLPVMVLLYINVAPVLGHGGLPMKCFIIVNLKGSSCTACSSRLGMNFDNCPCKQHAQ